MNDCIGILYSDSEFMDLSGSLILAPPVLVHMDRGHKSTGSRESTHARTLQRAACIVCIRDTGTLVAR